MTKKSKIDEEMATILKEEINKLGLKDASKLVSDLLEVERTSTNINDRRKPQKELNEIVDDAIDAEEGAK